MPSLVPRLFIRHLRNEKGTGAEMCPAIVSGIVTGGGGGRGAKGEEEVLSYWPVFFHCP